MGTTSLDALSRSTAPRRAARLSWTNVWRLLPLGGVVALAAVLRFVDLAAIGYGNHYYTAGVASMLQSWHNFFFVAAEPGGAVSIDKPPVGLWLQALSAHFLGINGPAMVLPEIVCGLLSVVVLYHLVRRSFGTAAGLLAALALAITPIVVATDRNNTIDSTLILVLLLAAWAFIKATESGRLRYLLLGAALVGIGFNVKMLQAYLPLPAFYALYFLGTRAGWGRKVAHLALATVLLLAVSLSWTAMVELTPADQRPYVGSSSDNSVFNLILGYNGVERLVGMGGSFPGGGPRPFPVAGGGFPRPGQNGGPGAPAPGGAFSPPGPNGNGGFIRRGLVFGGSRGGISGTGQPGVLRLFTAPLSKEVSWLLPFGLFSLGLLISSERLHWPLAPKHWAIVLWGGWLLAGAVFFSIAGFFHEYYMSMLAAPLAALVAIGVVELWRLREQRPWPALALLLLAAGATLGLQYVTAAAYVGQAGWLLLPLAFLGLGAVLLSLSALNRRRLFGLAGAASVVGALLLIPGVWSVLTMLNPSDNQSLPSAYSGRPSGPADGGKVQVNQALLNYLEANTPPTAYLLAVPSSMQGADYVIATGRPVLYLGGFMGQDQVLTADGLAALVAGGKLRYVYWGGQAGRRGFGSQSDLSVWVADHCTPVPGFDTLTRNAGAPDGTGDYLGSNGGVFRGFLGAAGIADMQVTLYDCGEQGGR